MCVTKSVADGTEKRNGEEEEGKTKVMQDEDHAKNGLFYSLAASTSLNGFGLAIGFDQDLQPAVGIDYDLGGLSLYAGYDAADEGGSVGATLSF